MYFFLWIFLASFITDSERYSSKIKTWEFVVIFLFFQQIPHFWRGKGVFFYAFPKFCFPQIECGGRWQEDHKTCDDFPSFTADEFWRLLALIKSAKVDCVYQWYQHSSWGQMSMGRELYFLFSRMDHLFNWRTDIDR